MYDNDIFNNDYSKESNFNDKKKKLHELFGIKDPTLLEDKKMIFNLYEIYFGEHPRKKDWKIFGYEFNPRFSFQENWKDYRHAIISILEFVGLGGRAHQGQDINLIINMFIYAAVGSVIGGIIAGFSQYFFFMPFVSWLLAGIISTFLLAITFVIFNRIFLARKSKKVKRKLKELYEDDVWAGFMSKIKEAVKHYIEEKKNFAYLKPDYLNPRKILILLRILNISQKMKSKNHTRVLEG